MNLSALILAISLSLFSTSSVGASCPKLPENAVKVRTNQLKTLQEKQMVLEAPMIESQPVASSPSSSEPVNLNDRRIATFNSLYNLYADFVGKYAKPGVIEWDRVIVTNWPFESKTTDVDSWTKEDLDLLDFLIAEKIIEFQFNSKPKRKYSEFLVLPMPLAAANEAAEIKRPRRSTSVLNSSSQVKVEMNVSSSSSDEESIKSVSLNVDFGSDSKFETQSESEESEDISVDRESVQSEKESSTIITRSQLKKSLKPKSKGKGPLKGKKYNFKNAKVLSTVRAHSERRRDLLERVLKIFRKQSGNSSAKEIDWSLFKVIYLQYHTVPFSFSLETEGDCATLENLMKNKYFGFANVSNQADRRSLVYEHLYKLYFQAVGPAKADPFFIKWNSVEINGWPDNLIRSYNHWKREDLDELEACLDRNGITFNAIQTEMAEKPSLSSSDVTIKAVEAKVEKKAEEMEADKASAISPRPKLIRLRRSSTKSYDTDEEDEKVWQSMAAEETRKPPVLVKVPKAIKKSHLKNEKSKIAGNITYKVTRRGIFRIVKAFVDRVSRNEMNRRMFNLQQVNASSSSSSSNALAVKKTEEPAFRESEEVSFKESLKASPAVLNDVSTSLTESIEAFESAQAGFSEKARHKRIVNEILRAYRLMKANIEAIVKKDASLAPSIGFVELNRFLKVFKETLSAVEPDGSLKRQILRKFIVESVNLHGRIAGLDYKASASSTQNNSFQLKITADRIFDADAFGFLSKSPITWTTNLEILEIALDEECFPIFNK